MGASAAGMVCYTGTDASGPYRLTQTTVGCLLVNVPRCVWYVQDEDSLIQIAARFSTNWLQVWHFNPMLLHPDDSLIPQSLLNIGHLYQVSPYAVLALLFAYAARVLTKTGVGEGGGGGLRGVVGAQVEPNDALAVLADRFGTTIMHIQMNNWDLTNVSASGLPVGMEICIIPSSCQTAANVQHV